jgi:hypothetical protein
MSDGAIRASATSRAAIRIAIADPISRSTSASLTELADCRTAARKAARAVQKEMAALQWNVIKQNRAKRPQGK